MAVTANIIARDLSGRGAGEGAVDQRSACSGLIDHASERPTRGIATKGKVGSLCAGVASASTSAPSTGPTRALAWRSARYRALNSARP